MNKTGEQAEQKGRERHAHGRRNSVLAASLSTHVERGHSDGLIVGHLVRHHVDQLLRDGARLHQDISRVDATTKLCERAKAGRADGGSRENVHRKQ